MPCRNAAASKTVEYREFVL